MYLKRHRRAGDEMPFAEERMGDERKCSLTGAAAADIRFTWKL